MMENFFGLAKAPFGQTPDPAFYFDSAAHHKALSYLHYGIQQAEGLVIITGEAGVGKTTLIDYFLSRMDQSQVLAVKLDWNDEKQGDVITHVLSAFGIAPHHSNGSDLEALENFLAEQYDLGRQVVLVVEGAHTLSAPMLNDLRSLTSITSGGVPLLQVFLAGEDGLHVTVGEAGMEDFRQRVIASCNLLPLTSEETAAYIDHRLYVAGYTQENSLVSDRAQELVFQHSCGIPRHINEICANALARAAEKNQEFVSAEIVQEVVGEISDRLPSPGGYQADLPDFAEPDGMPVDEEGQEFGTPPAAEQGSDTDFNDIARQIAEEMPPVTPEQAQEVPELVDAKDEPAVTSPSTDRIDALKADLAIFVEEVETGLGEMRSSMERLTGRLDELQNHHQTRQRLITGHVEKIDGVLGQWRRQA